MDNDYQPKNQQSTITFNGHTLTQAHAVSKNNTQTHTAKQTLTHRNSVMSLAVGCYTF